MLVTTKLRIPQIRLDQVPRARLVQRLEDGLGRGHHLSLVSAPAGYGKTMLIAEWVAQGDRPAAWVTLDAGDIDPARFWLHVIAAIQTVLPGVGHAAVAALCGPEPLHFESLLTGLINQVLENSKPFVLVLDDFHLANTPSIHSAVGFLLEHQPANLHLVISTRADPALPVFRLRARAQLTELRRADLRFSLNEALAFLNESMGLSLVEDQVAVLADRTEGWIVGMQLAALSLRGREDVDAFISSFTGSHHFVLEYLAEEVVRCQPAPVRQFLVETSVLQRLCGPLCDFLLEGAGEASGAGDLQRSIKLAPNVLHPISSGQEMLAFLEKQNLFVVPLDDERRWYRYHHLFADLLTNLLRQQRSAESIHELHRRASIWFEQSGSPDEAIQHALQAHAFERAAGLIERVAPRALAQGRLRALLLWMEAVPDLLLRSRPQLCLYLSWALHLTGHSGEAERILRDAREQVRARPLSTADEVLSGRMAALLTGIAASRGGISETVDQAHEALSHLPADDLVSRARVHVALGTAHAYQGDATQADEAWRHASQLALEADNPFLAAAAIELVAGSQIYHLGRLQEGEQALQQVLDFGSAPDGSLLPFTATAHALLADVLLERNDLGAAANCLDKGIELQLHGGIAHGLTHTYCAKARLARALGDRQGAEAALETARQATAALPMWHIILHLAACQTRLRLWLGDIDGAERWARTEQDVISQDLPIDLPTYLQEVRSLSVARVFLARCEVDKALETLASVLAGAESAGRMAHVIEANLLAALTLQTEGRTGQALDALERSLALGAPAGYVRLYLEAGKPLLLLLPKLRTHVLTQDGGGQSVDTDCLLQRIDQLLAAFDGPVLWTDLPTIERQPSIDGLLEPLTPRELEVLQLVCQGLSNRTIAEHLSVTLNTVKKHSSNIYGKMAVGSRAQAMVRARELRLC